MSADPPRVLRQRAQPPLRSRLLFLGLFFAILLLYLLPWLLAYRANGDAVPPLFGADLPLYLNLSNLQSAGPGLMANPWYGTAVAASDLIYRKFGLTFAAFHDAGWVMDGNWFWAVLVWSLGWTALIAKCGQRVVLKLAPRSVWLAAAGLALLMLVDLHFLPAIPSAWFHLPHLQAFERFSLPFIRNFYPQVSIPLLLLYLDRLMEALAGGSRWSWIAMAGMQALAFMLYPYATLLMAGTTALALLMALATRGPRPRLAVVAKFAIACAALDVAYILLVGSPASAGGASRTSLLHLDLVLLLHLALSKTLLLVVVLTVVAGFATDKERPSVRAVLVGLGAATVSLLLADAIVSPGLQVAHHMLFLVQISLVLMLAGTADGLSIDRDPRIVRWAAVVVLGFAIAHGTLTAYSTFTGMRAFNKTNAAQMAMVRRAGLAPDDLVLAASEAVDDPAAWVPLVSPARVLFCRNAEFAMGPGQEEGVQMPRRAAYLYFTGRDTAWVDGILSPATSVEKQNPLAPTTSRLLLEGPRRIQALADLRQQIDPLLAGMASGDPRTAALFRSYDRVVVVDSAEHPLFVPDRLARYLELIQITRSGGVELRWYRPLAADALH